MKLSLAYFLGALLTFTATSCDKDQDAIADSCSSNSRTIRQVKDVSATVRFDQTIQKYTLFAHQPGTYDVVDIGVLCYSGSIIPSAWQIEGNQVIFSGTYKEYTPQTDAPVGTTYYYLEILALREK